MIQPDINITRHEVRDAKMREGLAANVLVPRALPPPGAPGTRSTVSLTWDPLSFVTLSFVFPGVVEDRRGARSQEPGECMAKPEVRLSGGCCVGSGA